MKSVHFLEVKIPYVSNCLQALNLVLFFALFPFLLFKRLYVKIEFDLQSLNASTLKSLQQGENNTKMCTVHLQTQHILYLGVRDQCMNNSSMEK